MAKRNQTMILTQKITPSATKSFNNSTILKNGELILECSKSPTGYYIIPNITNKMRQRLMPEKQAPD